jgi:hypothetical protein
MDDPQRLIEVDLRVLEPFDCRLYKVITKDEPCIDPATQRRFWRSGHMTCAMLATFMRSLIHGELLCSRNVHPGEAIKAFEYECVPVGVRADSLTDHPGLRFPSAGVAHEKRAESASDVVMRTCEQIAHALARWPRLEVALESALLGGPSVCTCTATRAWVRFCAKPQLLAEKGDATHTLARKWPFWCSTTMGVIGMVHLRLVKEGKVQKEARHAAAYSLLAEAMDNDRLRGFFATAHDVPRQAQDKATRRDVAAAERFANEMRNTLLDAASPPVGQSAQQTLHAMLPPNREAVAYARACFALAESLLHATPSPATIFSGVCCDDHGKTPERRQLSRALKARSITLVRWSDEPVPKPLLFPPAWAEKGASPGSSNSTMLIDFGQLRQ